MGFPALKRVGPAGLTTSAANKYNPATNVKSVLRYIHIANTTAGALTASLYIGATGASVAGTEIMSAKSVPANDYVDEWVAIPMTASDFLTALASAGSNGLVLTLGVEEGAA